MSFIEHQDVWFFVFQDKLQEVLFPNIVDASDVTSLKCNLEGSFIFGRFVIDYVMIFDSSSKR